MSYPAAIINFLMMISKKTLYIGILITLGVGISVLVLLASQRDRISNNDVTGNQTVGTVPGYTLATVDEENAKTLAKSFVILYNTYSYDDLENFSALDDYATASMLESARQRQAELGQELKPGDEVITDIPAGQNLQMDISSIDQITVTLLANVTERQNETVTRQYPISARIVLVRERTVWVVDALEITQ